MGESREHSSLARSQSRSQRRVDLSPRGREHPRAGLGERLRLGASALAPRRDLPPSISSPRATEASAPVGSRAAGGRARARGRRGEALCGADAVRDRCGTEIWTGSRTLRHGRRGRDRVLPASSPTPRAKPQALRSTCTPALGRGRGHDPPARGSSRRRRAPGREVALPRRPRSAESELRAPPLEIELRGPAVPRGRSRRQARGARLECPHRLGPLAACPIERDTARASGTGIFDRASGRERTGVDSDWRTRRSSCGIQSRAKSRRAPPRPRRRRGRPTYARRRAGRRRPDDGSADLFETSRSSHRSTSGSSIS
jgi:hypothetical protein